MHQSFNEDSTNEIGNETVDLKGWGELFDTSHLKGDLRGRAVKGGAVTIISRSIEFLVHMGGTVILARLLSPQEFGLLAMVLAITGFFVIFKDMGLSDATIQSEKISHDQVSTLFWLNVSCGILIFITAAVISPVVAWFYKEPQLVLVTIISSVSFIFAGFSAQHLALLKRSMSFSRVAVVEIVAASGSVLAGIAMAFLGFGLWALVARTLLMAFLNMVGLWTFCKWRPGLPKRKSGVKSFVRFGANTTGFYLINYFARNFDKILVGWFAGPVILGFYHKAFHLFVLPVSQFSIPLQGVAVSSLTKLRSEPLKYKHFFLRALGLMAFMGMPLSTYLAAMGEGIILLLLGPAWVGAVDIFAAFALGAGMQIMYAAQGWLHVSLGRADRWFRWGIVGSACMVVFFIAGIPFGAVGVAAGYTISLYLLTFPALWYAGRPVGLTVKDIWDSIWKYYAASIAAGMAASVIAKNLANINVITRLIASFAGFVIVYLLTIVLLFRSFYPISSFFKLVLDNLPVKNRKVTVVDT